MDTKINYPISRLYLETIAETEGSVIHFYRDTLKEIEANPKRYPIKKGAKLKIKNFGAKGTEIEYLLSILATVIDMSNNVYNYIYNIPIWKWKEGRVGTNVDPKNTKDVFRTHHEDFADEINTMINHYKSTKIELVSIPGDINKLKPIYKSINDHVVGWSKDYDKYFKEEIEKEKEFPNTLDKQKKDLEQAYTDRYQKQNKIDSTEEIDEMVKHRDELIAALLERRDKGVKALEEIVNKVIELFRDFNKRYVVDILD